MFLRLIDFFITQLKAQGPSRTCNESKEEEVQDVVCRVQGVGCRAAGAPVLTAASSSSRWFACHK